MSSLYSRRKRSSSFGSYGAYRVQNPIEKPADPKPELIEGYAHICFDDEALWFRGNLLTADGQSYNLSGERIFINEEDVLPENKVAQSCVTNTNESSPDVIRDYPSPIRTSSHGSFELRSAGSDPSVGSSPSRKNSIDSQSERELQFILEETSSGDALKEPVLRKSPTSLPSLSPPVACSLPGSPVLSQQILNALDSLLIATSNTNGMSSISESNVGDANKESSTSPFRSRSGSRARQNMEMISVVYDIAVTDLEDGTQHTIRHVAGRKGNTFTLRSRQLCFLTDKSYWGQRAQMVIQKQLAVPELVGQKCHVYAGPMRFYVVPRPIFCEARSLTNWCW